MMNTTSTATRPTTSLRQMTDALARYAPAAGRVLLSLIFLLAGASKLMDWQGTSDYMASKGMPLIPVLLPAAAAVELLGGLSLLLGFRTRVGALALFLFLIPATVIFHNFWAYEGAAMQAQMQNFMKNLAIMGGLLLVAGFGAGPLSVDAEAGPRSDRI